MIVKAEQIAQQQVVTTHPRDMIDKAISLMDEHGIHHLPVVADDELVGMVSDRDILLAVGWQLSSARHSGNELDALAGPQRVEQIMSTPVVTLSPGESVRHAASLLVFQRISALPLVDGGRLRGILTASDILSKITHPDATVDSWKSLASEPVRDHMRAKVFTARARDPLSEIVRIFREKQVRHVPIVVAGRLSEQFLVGIVSDRDVRRALGTASVQNEQTRSRGDFFVGPTSVMDIMTTEVRTITATHTMAEAVELLLSYRIHALPVLTDQVLTGIITQTDVLRAVSTQEPK